MLGATLLITESIVNPVDAAFESIAGFSTTALSVVADPEELPRGVLAWRSLFMLLGRLELFPLLLMFAGPFRRARAGRRMRAPVRRRR